MPTRRSRVSFGRLSVCLASLAVVSACLNRSPAAEIVRITAENYQDVVPRGKEVDAIVGDWILKNDKVIAVIANPRLTRNANMTVRGVGGTLIDFTGREQESDQLSCLYAAGPRYLFTNSESVRLLDALGQELTPAETVGMRGSWVGISMVGESIAADGTRATVTYRLHDGTHQLEIETTIRNEGAAVVEVPVEYSLRCDGDLFDTRADAALGIFIAEDRYFRQCYGLRINDVVQLENYGKGRQILLRSSAPDGRLLRIASQASSTWSGAIVCGQGVPSIVSWAETNSARRETVSMSLRLQSPHGPVERAAVEIRRGGQSLGMVLSDPDGYARVELLPGKYTARIQSLGREIREHEFELGSQPRSDSITLSAGSRVRAKILELDGGPIPAKVQFFGMGQTENPNFGPDSAIATVRNVVYCAGGIFEQPLDPGQYRLLVSHGPEFDAQEIELTVAPDRITPFSVALKRSVDTAGWLSAEFHSHSSPSGDNVSHQTGRVLNLLAEHIEFAPCTEHNRIDSYLDDLVLLDAVDKLATCPGMELTGSPLPINHQNAFPLRRHFGQQDGAAPRTDSNPVKQIERLALWNDNSEKVVQINHPNIPQILGDRDLDGIPDAGFREMLGWMDVIEVHPPAAIMNTPAAEIRPKDKADNRMFAWMQLLNFDYLVPGVVNTDAHYNFHGSGWLRNYMRSSTDKPSEVLISEVIDVVEAGQMTMTTGPFLEASITIAEDESGRAYQVGESVPAGDRSAVLHVRVQCPNWFDVNRVQLFANGRPLESHNFKRATHTDFFSSDSAVRFERLIDLPAFAEDTHVIVVAIGEGLQLGPVMGPEYGSLAPVAVTNPFFLDVDGGGFHGNRDDLGVPIMLVPEPR